MIQFKRRMTAILLFFLLAPCPWVDAAEHQQPPTRITSERMRYTHQENRIEFIGRVHVDREGFELRSEKLVVFLQPAQLDSEADPGPELEDRVQVEKMIASGNVFLRHGDRTGRGEQATYWMDKEILRLEGNAVVQEGPTRLEGNVITLNVREKGLGVSGPAGRRVEGTFFLPREDEQ